MKRSLGIIISTMLLWSCEKVIDLPLQEAEQRIVVEAVITDIQDKTFIRLSKTGSMYDDTGYDVISDATVKVKHVGGDEYVFTEDPLNPGTYLNSELTIVISE